METEDKQFNPSDYKYLDNIPLSGWMWEFIRRSPDYSRRFNRIKELSKNAKLSPISQEFIFNKYELTKSSDDKERNNGCAKSIMHYYEGIIKENILLDFPSQIVCLLTKGLLMGDPFNTFIYLKGYQDLICISLY